MMKLYPALYAICILLVLGSCKKKNLNKPPVADAGPVQTIQLPVDSVTVNGSGSTDQDGTITAYAWRKVSGPGNPVIQNPNAVSTKISALVAGTYRFELQVTDDDGATATSNLSVNVLPANRVNKVPVSDAGPAQTVRLPLDSVTLTGSGTDQDGTVTGYLWSMISGPNIAAIRTPGSAVTKIKNLIEGVYRFQLMVVDNEGATGLDTVSVTVLPSLIQTVTYQPGNSTGHDAHLATINGNPGIADANFSEIPELSYSQWTYNSQGFGEGTLRVFLKFTELSNIPANAEIISARLSLYGVSSSLTAPQGNSHYPGSPYGSNPDNTAWIRRVTGNWQESTITWNNKPATTDVDRVAMPGSTSQFNYNVTDIDVTNMVKTMVSSSANYGFNISLQTEAIYRSMIFSSCEVADPARRPKLVVIYR